MVRMSMNARTPKPPLIYRSQHTSAGLASGYASLVSFCKRGSSNRLRMGASNYRYIMNAGNYTAPKRSHLVDGKRDTVLKVHWMELVGHKRLLQRCVVLEHQRVRPFAGNNHLCINQCMRCALYCAGTPYRQVSTR
jgi:hypothetical protein